MKSFFLRKRKKLLLLFVLPSIVFIIFYESRPQEVGISKYQDEDTLAQMAYTPVNDEEQQRRLPPPDLQQHQNNVSHSDNSAMQHKNIELDNKGRADLIEWVHQSNQNLVIRNRHLIDPILANVSHQEYNGTLRNISYNHLDESSIHKFLVILVQVHKRLNNLQALIESLRFTKHIEQVLLVFSHDFYDPKINELIATIDFCATTQIFYPFSMQMYPDKFPGEEKGDCPKKMKKAEALKMNCKNAAYADAFGNYREAKVVQIKHHFTWKLGFVFERLAITRHVNDLSVLLLEEDHYMMTDGIHVLRQLFNKILSNIDVVSLGHFEKSKQDVSMSSLNKYAKAIWHSSKHNTGLLLTRTQWTMLKDCSNAFCTYDDYNWDWTIQYVSSTCFHLQLVAIYPVSSRIIHIGECGFHHHLSNCSFKAKTDALRATYESKKNDFFPSKFTLSGVNDAIRKLGSSNGGWADPRDHNLCKSFFYRNTIRGTL